MVFRVELRNSGRRGIEKGYLKFCYHVASSEYFLIFFHVFFFVTVSFIVDLYTAT